MHNYVKEDYICPICLGIKGIENDDTMLKKPDLIYRDDLTSVFMNSFFITGNEGHLIVVPNEHFENIYDMPVEYANAIMATTKKMSILVKEAYPCDGITLRQNNGPAAGQHAFHFHLHIHPRYDNDTFNQEIANKRATTLEERQKYIDKLKKHVL